LTEDVVTRGHNWAIAVFLLSGGLLVAGPILDRPAER
jgi:hypothetical protein